MQCTGLGRVGRVTGLVRVPRAAVPPEQTHWSALTVFRAAGADGRPERRAPTSAVLPLAGRQSVVGWVRLVLPDNPEPTPTLNPNPT